MKRILEYVRPYYGAMLVGFAIKFVGTVMDLAIPWILSHIIDEVAPTGSRGTVWLWGGAMALCSALALLGNVIANRRASAVSRDVTRTLRHDLFAKVERLSAKQMDQTTVPSLISRLTTDSYNVNQTLGRIQRLGVRAPILLLGGVTVSLILDFRLSLVLLATLPLLALSVALISRRGIPLYARVQRAVDDMVRTVRDDVAGVRVIRALSKGDTECARFARDSEALSREQIHADTVMAATNPLMSLLLNGGLTGVVVAGAFWVNAGLTEPGRIIAFLSYFTIILNAVLSINKMLVMLSQAAASAERIAEVLDLPEEAPLPAAAPRKDAAHVIFDDVCFSYNGRSDDVEHVSFSVPRGGSFGVIGATGAGKTTLTMLLQRFYPVRSGAIYLNGENVDAMDDARLHGAFGAAFQSDSFFQGSIRDNVDLGRNLPEAQLRRAVCCAQAAEFIDALDDGWNHPVQARGANLSGGQRQRLLVARALAGNPEILILDDSSSALDYLTDAAMRAAIRREYAGTTLFLIAQRVSSVRECDQILVLDQGRTAGLGNHAQLMRGCPLYAQISRIQNGEEGGDGE